MLDVNGTFRRGTDLLGRRIRSLKLRVLCFQGQQALKKGVKVRIRD